jgi:hypothetical protein
MKQMKTILGTFLVAVLLVVTRTEASTVHYMPGQSNKQENGGGHHRGMIADNKHSQRDFLPREKWKEYNDKGKHDDHEGGHDGFDGWHDSHKGRHDGFDGWHDSHKGRHNGFDHGGFDGWSGSHEGWHDGFDGWYQHNKEFCHEKPVPPVPVPAAFWLFGSGMLLLGRIATRRRA